MPELLEAVGLDRWLPASTVEMSGTVDALVWLMIGLALGALFVLWRSKAKKRGRKPRYQSRRFLFTKTEWAFAAPLQKAIGQRYLMMGKVRIADLLSVESHPQIERSEWMRHFAKISSKHVDFVLVWPDSGRVACCIELDDPSHERADRVARDIFVNAAFKEAGVPLLRIPTQKQYSAKKLREQIESVALQS